MTDMQFIADIEMEFSEATELDRMYKAFEGYSEKLEQLKSELNGKSKNTDNEK